MKEVEIMKEVGTMKEEEIMKLGVTTMMKFKARVNKASN
jgi:hypothetical protein